MDSTRVLVKAYGNPGRLDDGIGPVFASKLEEKKLQNVVVDCDYQLNVEDAKDISEHDVVIFVDASLSGSEPFYFSSLTPQPALGFSSHSVEPEVLLHMAANLFSASAKGYALGIRGYDFNEFGEGLSEKARANLEQALEFLTTQLEAKTFKERGTPPQGLRKEQLA